MYKDFKVFCQLNEYHFKPQVNNNSTPVTLNPFYLNIGSKGIRYGRQHSRHIRRKTIRHFILQDAWDFC